MSKKISILLFLLLLLHIGTLLFAEVNSNESSLSSKERLDLLEQKIEQISKQDLYGKWQTKNQNGRINCGLFGEGNFLYWKAMVDGLSYAQLFKPTVINPPQDIKVKLSNKELDFQWRPGFKVGLGYLFSSKDEWELRLDWTYFHAKAQNTATFADPIDINVAHLRPTWLPFILGALADKGQANWSLQFNLLDLSLGKSLFLGKWLSFKPQAGIRAAWIDQCYKVKYHAAFLFPNQSGQNSSLFANTGLNADNDFQGIGMKIGSDFGWHLTPCFSICGGAFLSFLYGKFEVKETFNGNLLLSFDGTNYFLVPETAKFKSPHHAVRPAIETEVGIKWQKLFNEERYRISLGAFYQLSFWFNQNELTNQLIVPSNNATIFSFNTKGNLQFEGCRFQARLDF